MALNGTNPFEIITDLFGGDLPEEMLTPQVEEYLKSEFSFLSFIHSLLFRRQVVPASCNLDRVRRFLRCRRAVDRSLLLRLPIHLERAHQAERLLLDLTASDHDSMRFYWDGHSEGVYRSSRSLYSVRV
jgi:hypothetical protein